MKKALLSLVLALVCLPAAFAQADAGRVFVTLDTSTCTPYKWVNGVTYNADTNVTYISNDTIYVLVYHRQQSYNHTSNTPHPVMGECVAYWNNKTWPTAGTFRDTLQSVGGCDSIIRIKVTLAKADSVQEVTVCGSYTAPWGTEYTESVEIDTTIVRDSTCTYNYTLSLTVNPVYSQNIQVTAGCFYLWNEDTISDFLTHTKTFTTTEGCDSTINLTVTTFSGNNYDTADVAACDFFVSYWGARLTVSGQYNHDTLIGTYPTTTGTAPCHQYNTLNLIIDRTIIDTNLVTPVSIQAGCFYNWGGSSITDTMIHYYTFQTNAAKCDSLAAIKVTSYDSIEYDTIRVSYCGQPYKWQGSYLPATLQFYKDTIHTVTETTESCTTHHTLDLTMVKNRKTETVTKCDTVYSYSYKTVSYNASNVISTQSATAKFRAAGTYQVDPATGDSLYSVDNKKCITLNTLKLNLNIPQQRYRNPDTMAVSGCDRIKFNLDKKTTYFTNSCDTLLIKGTHSGKKCYDSIVYLNVTVKKSTTRTIDTTVCDGFYWDVDNAYHAHTSCDTVRLSGQTNAAGCDSTVTLNLTVNYTPVVNILGEWNLEPGQSTVLKASPDMTIKQYKWYVNSESTPRSTADSLVLANVNSNTDVRLTSTSTKNCTATSWITVTATVGIDDVDALSVNLYPNPTSRFLTVESAEGISEVVIYNGIGQQVISRRNEGNSLQLDLGSLAAGSYTLRIVGNDNHQTTRKFIVNK